jgi:hypothetical protein
MARLDRLRTAQHPVINGRSARSELLEAGYEKALSPALNNSGASRASASKEAADCSPRTAIVVAAPAPPDHRSGREAHSRHSGETPVSGRIVRGGVCRRNGRCRRSRAEKDALVAGRVCGHLAW